MLPCVYIFTKFDYQQKFQAQKFVFKLEDKQLILVIQQLPEAEDSAKEKDVDIGGDGDNKSQKLSFQFLEPAKPADDVEREENNGMIQ